MKLTPMGNVFEGTSIETIIVLGLFAFSLMMSALVIRGLELRKWSSWLYGAIVFGCYFIIGYLLGGIKAGLEMGGIASFMFMYTGAMRVSHKKLAKDIRSRLNEAADPRREEDRSPDQKNK